MEIIPDISIGVNILIASERINVVWAAVIVIVISASSVFLIFSKNLEKTYHINNQNIIPPTTIDKNDNHQWINEVDNEKASHFAKSSNIESIITNNANEVPSLNKLSHSNIKDNLLGAQTDLNNASTATGSVAEIIAPKSSVTINGIWKPIKLNIKYKDHQITKVDIKSPKTAREKIVFPFLSKSL